ncbi:hypothetical protein BDF20DRAFT_831046 [Mycotypha africana]|uniref:uncharacterized protein n=1 Tax=Mycotypha africana TaxID=64632 RepID=UPI0022FFE050|nr:uncharacterized protein BDF20DRAFT_831046 [Mycotypha africana]KAI8990956.1 hypothetical protein BDF20DRAFT_831046 [Mycotypha africana]
MCYLTTRRDSHWSLQTLADQEENLMIEFYFLDAVLSEIWVAKNALLAPVLPRIDNSFWLRRNTSLGNPCQRVYTARIFSNIIYSSHDKDQYQIDEFFRSFGMKTPCGYLCAINRCDLTESGTVSMGTTDTFALSSLITAQPLSLLISRL